MKNLENNATQIYNFSLRKEVYISWHTPCCSNFFVFVVIMNSTLIQSKEKKFWEKIYYNYIQSNDLKSGEKKVKKFFFVSLHYAFGWKYICHYSKHRVNLKKKTLLGAGLVFFLFISEIFFVRPMEIFFGQIFFISLLIKATEGIFLVMVYSSSLMIPSFIHVKKSDKTQGDILIRGGYLKTKIIKEGLLQAGCSCLGWNWAKLSKLSVQTNTM